MNSRFDTRMSPLVVRPINIDSEENFHSRSAPSMRPRLSFLHEKGLMIAKQFRDWNEISRINFIKNPLESSQSITETRKKSIALPFSPMVIRDSEIFSSKATSLDNYYSGIASVFVNEVCKDEVKRRITYKNDLWGNFNLFPELYEDIVSPTVKFRELIDIFTVSGVLTLEAIVSGLSYLIKSPLTGDLVYGKLTLRLMQLQNIEILRNYRFLTYLDFSNNYLTSLHVLAELPYLQYLNVDYNRLEQVLNYETPQWYLTEVHYKFNVVETIRDMTIFWSVTDLDLSHNNITAITGLENLRFLRRLNLSFNHIQRLENLNNLRLYWLDISYNKLSSFEKAPKGLSTLCSLEYINVNENNLKSFRIFAGSYGLKEIHARNNSMTDILDMAVFCKYLLHVTVLDLRENPICPLASYKDVVYSTFPSLLTLDGKDVDYIEQREYIMDFKPDIRTAVSRRLLRMLYVEHLSRAIVSPYTPPADSTSIPLIVLVGKDCLGKGRLLRQLVEKHPNHLQEAIPHTTASHHYPPHYHSVSREKFDHMLIDGELLTYYETNGNCYGLSRKEAFVQDGKARVVRMHLEGAVMLQQRYLRPYLILCTTQDPSDLALRQVLRVQSRYNRTQSFVDSTTLQVLVSGRLEVVGILNEIILRLPDELTEQEQYVRESETSMGQEIKQKDTEQRRSDGYNQSAACGHASTDQSGHDTLDIFQKPSATSSRDRSSYNDSEVKSTKAECTSIDTADKKYRKPSFGSTFRDPQDMLSATKSVKSVTFVHAADDSQKPAEEQTAHTPQAPPYELLKSISKKPSASSVATKAEPWQEEGLQPQPATDDSIFGVFSREAHLNENVYDLGCTSSVREFVAEAVLKDLTTQTTHFVRIPNTHFVDMSSQVGDSYESFHRKFPGYFHDTVSTDDLNAAFAKLENIVKDIFNRQRTLRPMMDINFKNDPYYQMRVDEIRQIIAPNRLFY